MKRKQCRVCNKWFDSENGLVSCPKHSFGETAPQEEKSKLHKENCMHQDCEPRIVCLCDCLKEEGEKKCCENCLSGDCFGTNCKCHSPKQEECKHQTCREEGEHCLWERMKVAQDSTWEEFENKYSFMLNPDKPDSFVRQEFHQDLTSLISKEREKGYREGYEKGHLLAVETKKFYYTTGYETAKDEVREMVGREIKELPDGPWNEIEQGKWQVLATLSKKLSSLQEKKSNE